jgi:integrase
MARNFTDKHVAALKPRDKQYAQPDPQLPGHYVRVNPTGSRTYVAVARDPRGKQVWTTIGNAAFMEIEEAREAARSVIKRVKDGQDRHGPKSLESVATEWLHRHVDANGLRDEKEIRRVLHKHILPEWGGREFEGVRRGDVAALMDKVEDGSGARTADKVLEIMSGLCHWYEKRHENYTSPIIRGMRRYKTADHARDRILSDDEIRKLWKASETANGYGALVRLLLLTGQRLSKVVAMRWDEIDPDGVWHIPAEKREKGNARELVLPQLALDIINAQPRFASNPYVLASRVNGGHIAKVKTKLKAFRHATCFENFRLHDLRRTARSLMSRAGVSPHVAERVLGHAIKGVEGTYDRHRYQEEKGHALKALAGLIESIINPADNVVRIARK